MFEKGAVTYFAVYRLNHGPQIRFTKHQVYKVQFGKNSISAIWFQTKLFYFPCLNYLTEKIRLALDEGYIGRGIFADWQKAFDTVDHQILLSKPNYYGI